MHNPAPANWVTCSFWDMAFYVREDNRVFYAIADKVDMLNDSPEWRTWWVQQSDLPLELLWCVEPGDRVGESQRRTTKVIRYTERFAEPEFRSVPDVDVSARAAKEVEDALMFVVRRRDLAAHRRVGLGDSASAGMGHGPTSAPSAAVEDVRALAVRSACPLRCELWRSRARGIGPWSLTAGTMPIWRSMSRTARWISGTCRTDGPSVIESEPMPCRLHDRRTPRCCARGMWMNLKSGVTGCTPQLSVTSPLRTRTTTRW